MEPKPISAYIAAGMSMHLRSAIDDQSHKIDENEQAIISTFKRGLELVLEGIEVFFGFRDHFPIDVDVEQVVGLSFYGVNLEGWKSKGDLYENMKERFLHYRWVSEKIENRVRLSEKEKKQADELILFCGNIVSEQERENYHRTFADEF